jgi:hypothetical protein
MQSTITHSEGGSMYAGPEAVSVFRAYVIASALKMYAKHKIKANRAYTPTNMLAAVHEITGMKFKRTQMMEAAQFLQLWADAKRMGINETSTRPEDIGHLYAIARWGCDDKAEIVDMVKRLNLRGTMLLDEIDRQAEKHGLDDPINDPAIEMDPAKAEQRRKACANLREIAANGR